MLSWDRNPTFQVTEKVLAQQNIVDIAKRKILNEHAFNDTLGGLFSAWALKSIGRDKYVVFFQPLSETQTLLLVQRAPYEAVRPSRKSGLYCADFLSIPEDLRALHGKLLYNAGVAQSSGHADGMLEELEAAPNNSPVALREWVCAQTLSDATRYGWLWGGRGICLNAPPALFQAMLTAPGQTRSLLCEAFEQMLCLHLGLQLQLSFFSCHIKQTIPIQFSEIDVVLCRIHRSSRERGLWKPGCGRELKTEIARDRLMVVENSSGLDSQSQSDQLEPENRWHPKIINWLALGQLGFEQVHLHLCSLVPLQIQSAALQYGLDETPRITHFALDEKFSNSIRDNIWTRETLFDACNAYCSAAGQQTETFFK